MSELISRQAAIRWVKTECNPYGKPTLDFESGKKVIEHLEQMPSADRPQGEWIETDMRCYGATVYKCSVCGDDVDEMPTVMGVPKYKFCPYCGAMMKGADDEVTTV